MYISLFWLWIIVTIIASAAYESGKEDHEDE